jgi:hypothetical protein
MDRQVVYPDFPGGLPVYASDHIDQGGLPGAGLPDNRYKFSLEYIQINPFQSEHTSSGGIVNFFYPT